MTPKRWFFGSNPKADERRCGSMAGAACRTCGQPLVMKTRGRNRRYCSARCCRSAERDRIDDLTPDQIDRAFADAKERCRATHRFTVDPWQKGGGGYGVV